VIFCNKDKFWTALVDALDLPGLATDPRFATFADRLTHKAALLEILAPRFAARTTQEWLARLSGSVPCAPVHTMRQALDDEQVRLREMIVEVTHPRFHYPPERIAALRVAGVLGDAGPEATAS